MAEDYGKLYQGQPGTSAATVYTAPATAGSHVIIVKIVALNMGAAAASIGLFHDGTAVSNRIIPDVPLNPNEWLKDADGFFMDPSDTLAAIASVASSITLTIYGVEVTPG
jgi:hypothetical protein